MRDWVDARRVHVLLVAASIWFALLGVFYGLDVGSQVFWPWLWPSMFMAAALSVAAYAARPGSTWLFKAAGLIGYVALGSQWVRIVTNLFADGFDRHDWSRVAGMLVFIGLAFAWRVIWNNGIGRYYDRARYGFDPNGRT